jgi:hypothetical protein
MPRRALSGAADHEYGTTSSAATRIRQEGPCDDRSSFEVDIHA